MGIRKDFVGLGSIGKTLTELTASVDDDKTGIGRRTVTRRERTDGWSRIPHVNEKQCQEKHRKKTAMERFGGSHGGHLYPDKFRLTKSHFRMKHEPKMYCPTRASFIVTSHSLIYFPRP